MCDVADRALSSHKQTAVQQLIATKSCLLPKPPLLTVLQTQQSVAKSQIMTCRDRELGQPYGTGKKLNVFPAEHVCPDDS